MNRGLNVALTRGFAFLGGPRPTPPSALLFTHGAETFKQLRELGFNHDAHT